MGPACVLVQLRLLYDGLQPAAISELELLPQAGLGLALSSTGSASAFDTVGTADGNGGGGTVGPHGLALPLVVQPRGVVTAAFTLTKVGGGRRTTGVDQDPTGALGAAGAADGGTARPGGDAFEGGSSVAGRFGPGGSSGAVGTAGNGAGGSGSGEGGAADGGLVPALGGGEDHCKLVLVYAVLADAACAAAPEEILGPALEPICAGPFPAPPLSHFAAPAPASSPAAAHLAGAASLTAALGGAGGGMGCLAEEDPALGSNLGGTKNQRASGSSSSSSSGEGEQGDAYSTSTGPTCLAQTLMATIRPGQPSPSYSLAAGCASSTPTCPPSLFSWPFLLEFPPDSRLGGGSRNTVSVTFLGPASAVVGQPVALMWHISRQGSASPHGAAGGGGGGAGPNNLLVGDGGGLGGAGGGMMAGAGADAGGANAASPAAGCEAVVYEVVEGGGEGEGGVQGRWRLGVGCKGVVRLGCGRGSVAVVEAVVAPGAVGLLPPPRLLLRGVHDVGPLAAGGGEGDALVSPAAATAPHDSAPLVLVLPQRGV